MRQLKFEHPSLQPMVLSPLNECGVEKLVCTFVRPTVLPYSHLFDVDACAKFVSDFIYYSADRAFTGSLNSPSRVLQEQMGNSLEMSTVLVSLLRCSSPSSSFSSSFSFSSLLLLLLPPPPSPLSSYLTDYL